MGQTDLGQWAPIVAMFVAVAAFAALIASGVHQDAGMPGLRHRDRRKAIRRARRPALVAGILIGALCLLADISETALVQVAFVVVAACVFCATSRLRKQAQPGAASAARKRRTDPLS